MLASGALTSALTKLRSRKTALNALDAFYSELVKGVHGDYFGEFSDIDQNDGRVLGASKPRWDAAGIANQDSALRQTIGQAFQSTSQFTLPDFGAHLTTGPAARQQIVRPAAAPAITPATPKTLPRPIHATCGVPGIGDLQIELCQICCQGEMSARAAEG